MVGDQVYLDSGTAAEKIWPTHLKTSPARRRQLMAGRYRDHWQRAPIRKVMANTPTYMLWSDHEIRDGWGSWASDSPTLQALYPKGAAIAAEYNAYFEDARKVYWHFQMCHNFAVPVAEPYVAGTRTTIPVHFQCGRLAVLMLDDRGDRDLWRESHRALGEAQWNFVENEYLPNLVPDTDSLAIVTQGPVVGMAPNGEVMRRLGDREDDVELFKRGDAKGLLALQGGSATFGDYVHAGVDRLVFKDLVPDNDLRLSDFDDLRDQWSHPRCRPEQERLIRRAGEARLVNRGVGSPRAVMFIGGDVHSGALYEITVTNPRVHRVVPDLVGNRTGKISRRRTEAGRRSHRGRGHSRPAAARRRRLQLRRHPHPLQWRDARHHEHPRPSEHKRGLHGQGAVRSAGRATRRSPLGAIPGARGSPLV